MKRVLTLLLLAWSVFGWAQRTAVREEVLSDWNKASGLDCVYDCSPKAQTPAPSGYKAFYISHYARHGSRYAYTEKTYSVPLEVLRSGADAGLLTPRGAALLTALEAFWAEHRWQVGDLTPLGWAQHEWIAAQMVQSFPGAFGKGSRVDGCSSPSPRAIMSMTSECLSLARKAPKTAIYTHQSMLDVQATRPNHGGENPFRYTGPENVFPYPDSNEAFLEHVFPEYGNVLKRLLRDPSRCLGGRTEMRILHYLYMLVGGMNSLPEAERIDVSGIFTPSEYAHMWEAFNYESLREYIKYRTSCSAVIDDMVAKADERLALRRGAKGRVDRNAACGADLRFGHDHVLLTLLQIMDIDRMGQYPASADDLPLWFQNFRSPMAANIQLVFFDKACGRGDVLVKVLLNGEEVRLGSLKGIDAAPDGPFYRWEDLRSYLNARTALFVTR